MGDRKQPTPVDESQVRPEPPPAPPRKRVEFTPLGPEFSVPLLRVNPGRDGMTLRDWFAGQALSGLLKREPTAEYVARRAYDYADAMLTAREASE